MRRRELDGGAIRGRVDCLRRYIADGIRLRTMSVASADGDEEQKDANRTSSHECLAWSSPGEVERRLERGSVNLLDQRGDARDDRTCTRLREVARGV
jgi:hypothetical protein